MPVGNRLEDVNLAFFPLTPMENVDPAADPSKTPATDPKAPSGTDPQKPATGADDKVPGTWDEVFAHERFKKLNADAKEAKAELKKRADADAAAEEKRQIAAGEHQKVIDALKPQAEKATQYEERVTKIVEKRIEALPEEAKTLVPGGLSPLEKLDYIDTNFDMLMSLGKPRTVGKSTIPGRTERATAGNSIVRYTTQQLLDTKFYTDNEADIKLAMKEGRIDE